MMLHLGPVGGTRQHGRLFGSTSTENGKTQSGWDIPVLETVATKGEGMTELADMLGKHMTYLRESGEWLKREKERSWREVETLLQVRFMSQFQAAVPGQTRDSLLTAVAQREVDPYTAVNQLLSKTESG
jgi:LAO/AO transport system kinase